MSIPILFVRYAPGACGTFLLTVLSSSDAVACWCPDLQRQKGTADFPRKFLQWFQSRFTTDLDQHLKHEPHHPYKLDFFSAKYHRGDDIEAQNFLHNLETRDDKHFLHNIKHNILTPLRLNKSVVPKFGLNNKVINIYIDAASKKWLHRTRFIKLFAKDKDGYVLKEQHPDYLAAKNYTTQFNNVYQVTDSHHGFVKRYVINDATVKIMSDRDAIVEHASNRDCSQHWVNLSELLQPQSAAQCMMTLSQALKLDLDKDLVARCCEHYYETNVMPMLKKKC